MYRYISHSYKCNFPNTTHVRLPISELLSEHLVTDMFSVVFVPVNVSYEQGCNIQALTKETLGIHL